MKRTVAIGVGILAISGTMAAQLVASHASTGSIQRPSQTAQLQNRPVAKVNGTVLTETDLLREEYSIFPYARQHGGAIPKEMEPQIRNGAMKMIIFEELVYQEAQRRKMTVPPAKLQRAETDFRKQFDTPQEYNLLLQSEFHGSQKLLRSKIERSLLIEALLKSEIDSKSAISAVEARAFYDKNPVRFQVPESFTFQTISILPPEKATPQQLKEAAKRAQDALKQAKATKTDEEFGMLAEKISDDDYRVMMGQHKPVRREQLAPQVVTALLAMKPGDVSNLIQIEQAYTVVRLNAHTPAGKQKFQDVKAQVEKELQQQKTNQLRSALDKRLMKNAKVEEL
ncbi:MAG TPA: peptidylprolyl isomerase [Terriglobales bacterium]|nr:peptidylprolyl isomerase [Terriglobales bacterium]